MEDLKNFLIGLIIFVIKATLIGFVVYLVWKIIMRTWQKVDEKLAE